MPDTGERALDPCLPGCETSSCGHSGQAWCPFRPDERFEELRGVDLSCLHCGVALEGQVERVCKVVWVDCGVIEGGGGGNVNCAP